MVVLWLLVVDVVDVVLLLPFFVLFLLLSSSVSSLSWWLVVCVKDAGSHQQSHVCDKLCPYLENSVALYIEY